MLLLDTYTGKKEQYIMICRLCQKEFKDYQNKKRTRCGSCNTKIRRIRNKQAAISLLGGKCSQCGYSEHLAALEFHHTSNNKEFNIGDVANKSWNSIKNEISKCQLLCSNCHRIFHSNRNESKWIKEAKKYQGKMLVLANKLI